MTTYKTTAAAALALALAAQLPAGQARAQALLPEKALPMILAPAADTVAYNQRTIHYAVPSTMGYSATADKDWLGIRQNKNGIYVTAEENLLPEGRTATIKIEGRDGKSAGSFTLHQTANNAAAEMFDGKVTPTSASASSENPKEGIAKSLDGLTHSLYHSNYFGGVSSSNPVTLTYNFANGADIDYIEYVPRTSGTNGIFQKFELLVKTKGQSKFVSQGKYEWPLTNDPKTINIEGGLKNVTGIQFRVTQGGGGFASCAEMVFMQSLDKNGDYALFADDLLTKLADGTTQDKIAAMEDPLLRSLAAQLYANQYPTEYRVAEYKCHNSPQYYSDLWNAPGKLYDQMAGVTGINIAANTSQAVIVEGIPDTMAVKLKVVSWYEGREGTNSDGPVEQQYTLHNGLNVIRYDHGMDGLAYICYYDNYGNSAKQPAIKAHFINGQVNGYLSPEKTNEEMHLLTANAKNHCMDVVGNKVHSVWTSKGLHDYCRAVDGSIGYRQWMNACDSIVGWEHDLLGFTKYNSQPDLNTMAYVNFTYYMFQGGYGVSFHRNQESRVLNCKTIIHNDWDAIWGLSHEWGHQHQMTPYFCWMGTSEITNNMNSWYNCQHMGYPYQMCSNASGDYVRALKILFKDITAQELSDYSKAGYKVPGYNGVANVKYDNSAGNNSSRRLEAYKNSSVFSYSPKLKAFVETMKDSKIASVDENPAKAMSVWEFGVNATEGVYNSVGEGLQPFLILHNYFTYYGGKPDFAQDWYEALRQNDKDGGSQIEKKSEVADKYELLASAQNNNKNNRWADFKRLYPNSCWTVNNYISGTNSSQWENSAPYVLNYIRKVSRLSGYNLVPYFEKWGFLRQIALRINDYGWKNHALTEDMYNEFIADMDALVQSGELKTMPEGFMDTILKAKFKEFPHPTFAN